MKLTPCFPCVGAEVPEIEALRILPARKSREGWPVSGARPPFAVNPASSYGLIFFQRALSAGALFKGLRPDSLGGRA